MSILSSLRRATAAAVAAFALATATGAAGVASAASHPTGPDPTADVIAQPSGPFPVTAARLSDAASPDFRDATIYAPIAAPGQTFGAVAVSPGFLASQATLGWLARRLATQGFVTIVFTPNSPFATPVQRSRALMGALSYLATKSVVKQLVDPTRLAVVGHSMGGGAALEAARRNLTLKAAVAIAPWSQWTSFQQIRTPTLVIGFKPDNIAPIVRHAKPMYRSLDPALPKAYLELNISHAEPSLHPMNDISRSTTDWLKRFVDDDARYTKTLCPTVLGVRPEVITGYQSTCGAGPLFAAAA